MIYLLLNYVATGIPENAIFPANFFLYPNPVSDRSILSFYNEKNESFDFKIFDVTGKCLESVSGIISNEVEIDKNTLPAGLYVFRLSSEKGTVISGKFIVE